MFTTYHMSVIFLSVYPGTVTGKSKRCNLQRIILKNKKISMFLTVNIIDMTTQGFKEVNVEKRHPAPGCSYSEP